MDDLEHRQSEHELSLASINRLGHLLQVLIAACDVSNGQFPERDVPIEQAGRWLSEKERHPSKSPVVGPEHERTAQEIVASIEDAVQILAGRLGQEWRRRRTGDSVERRGRLDGQAWTLGSVIYRLERRPILRGEVELRRTEPVAPDIPDGVFNYLVTVPGTRDQLVRETHGHWGYHYHYLDDRNRRSDTLLTFDRESASAAKATLCWERHAENHKFKARAGMWGMDKRENVYSVCHPDTFRFSFTDFKRPASDAEVVWPASKNVA